MSQGITERRRFEVFTFHEYVKDRQVKTSWLRVGMGFENADGSFNLHLNALPVTNPRTGSADLHMRLPRPRPAEYVEGAGETDPADPFGGIPVSEL